MSHLDYGLQNKTIPARWSRCRSSCQRPPHCSPRATVCPSPIAVVGLRPEPRGSCAASCALVDGASLVERRAACGGQCLDACRSGELTARSLALTHLLWKIGQVLLRPMPGIVLQVCSPEPFKSLVKELDLISPLPGAAPSAGGPGDPAPRTGRSAQPRRRGGLSGGVHAGARAGCHW